MLNQQNNYAIMQQNKKINKYIKKKQLLPFRHEKIYPLTFQSFSRN